MKVAAIGQGFGVSCKSATEIISPGNSVTTIGEAVLRSIEDESFDRAKFIVAFATRSGVQTILDAIDRSSLIDVQYYVGTDQEATTEQALKLLDQSDIDASWIRMRSSSRTYHPKVYLFEGEEKARLIVGSANVTQPGLRSNIEAAMIYEKEPGDSNGNDPIGDIRESLVDPVEEYSEPLTAASIEELRNRGYLGDESNRDFASGNAISGNSSDDEELPPMGVTVPATPPSLPTSAVDEESSNVADERTSHELPARAELPPIPEIDLESFDNPTNRRFYERLLNGTQNQPSQMRRIIYSEGEITQGELNRRMVRDHGTENVDSGSLIASLRVLTTTTQEVEKQGRGDNAPLIWVGNTSHQ